jgi:hypothetical protein
MYKRKPQISLTPDILQLLGSLGLRGLLWQQVLVDVWQNTTLSNGDMAEQLVQLLIVSDGQLQVSWDDSGLLVVTGSVTSQLQDFSSQILENSGQVHWGTRTNTLSVVTLSEQTVDSTNWKSQTCLSRTRLRSLFGRACLTTFTTGHYYLCVFEEKQQPSMILHHSGELPSLYTMLIFVGVVVL